MNDRPTDEHGIEHAPSCAMPGWISDTAATAGWHVLRCSGCGRVRLVRAGDGDRQKARVTR